VWGCGGGGGFWGVGGVWGWQERYKNKKTPRKENKGSRGTKEIRTKSTRHDTYPEGDQLRAYGNGDNKNVTWADVGAKKKIVGSVVRAN